MSADKKYELLKKIDNPSELRQMEMGQLPEVCSELRQYILETLSSHPGHLASSLGAVEIAVALHYALNTPEDRIVWDVGHQAYAHKILTGRREAFRHLREKGGPSGFPLPLESESDSFVAGHASNSISAALGMSVADKMLGAQRRVCAVIGDGAMSGGLAFEGLNNAGSVDNDLLVLLNDNHRSIDAARGGMSQYLLDITTSKTYNTIRWKLYRLAVRLRLLDRHRRDRILRAGNRIKAAIGNQKHNFFESMSVRYFGPVDGNNVEELVKVISRVKDFKGPKVIHCLTKKGKGYAPAEQDVTTWHAPGYFDVETGERKKSTSQKKWQDVMGETLTEMAREDKRIVGVTAAMMSGTGMSSLHGEMPERVFDVGIAEEHAVTFSAGLAKEGLKPFCAIYSTFLQRAIDNIVHDCAILNLPVTLLIDRAGVVGADGRTHHGALDIALLRCVPNLSISAPSDAKSLRALMNLARTGEHGVMAIRYPRGTCQWMGNDTDGDIEYGKARRLMDGDDVKVAVLALGPSAMEVRDELVAKGKKEVGVYDMVWAKPIDEALVEELNNRGVRQFITIEDGVKIGGMGEGVEVLVSSMNQDAEVTIIAYPDQFVGHGTVAEQRKEMGTDLQSIMDAIDTAIEKVNKE